VAIVHDAVKESGRVLPRPSAIFHVYASVERGKVSSNSSTHEATKFSDSVCPICISAFKCLFIQTQPTLAGATTLELQISD
jgi:hypothetical protein